MFDGGLDENDLAKIQQYFYDGFDFCVSELEKENAELKAKNKWYSEQVCNKECAEVWGNLTKAKEIIKGWLEDFYSPKAFHDKRAKLVEQSEQFLNSKVEE